jgi:uncharacterized iron-regulated membrane protein
MKVFFRTIHLYTSLAAGLIICCSCITGTMLVFEKEITHMLHPQKYYVTSQQSRMPLASLVKMSLKSVPKAKLVSVTVYNDANRALEMERGTPAEKIKKGNHQLAVDAKAQESKKADKATTTFFVNPYTGSSLGQFNRKQSFLYSVEMLHRYLLAGKGSIGATIVNIATLLFLCILITGVILWWPKTKKILRQRLKIKWDSNIKRLTHDLHVVTGFYTSIFLIIIALTGIIMSFKWADQALFAITGSKQPTEQINLPASRYVAGAKRISLDDAVKSLGAPIKNAAYYTIKIPRDSSEVYSISVLPKGAAEAAADTYYIDQYSGQLAGVETFASKSLGQRIRALVKPVHMGTIYGMPTKIMSFLVCLLSLIFPVTGLMMWLNRIKVKKPAKKVKEKVKLAYALVD